MQRHALLINPFYPKDPHASFGKHVLTPTLALTSIAGGHAAGLDRFATGTKTCCRARRRGDPFPQVVGITVHLTFADRAFELAGWYRERGAKVILGGLHVLSCPDEVPPHADALAIGEGVQLWPQHPCATSSADAATAVYRRQLSPSRIATTRRRAATCSRAPVPDDHQPDRHARLPQPLRLLLSLHRRACTCPTWCATSEQIVAEFAADGQPYAVFIDNNLGSRPDYLRQLVPGPAAAGTRSGARPSPST